MRSALNTKIHIPTTFHLQLSHLKLHPFSKLSAIKLLDTLSQHLQGKISPFLAQKTEPELDYSSLKFNKLYSCIR